MVITHKEQDHGTDRHEDWRRPNNDERWPSDSIIGSGSGDAPVGGGSSNSSYEIGEL